MTRFYVATSLERAKRAALLARVLDLEYGWVPSYAWWDHGSVQDDGPERIQEVAERELQGVREADVVIVLLPGGRGTHIELGAALALWKPVYLLTPDAGAMEQDGRTCCFYLHPGIHRVVGGLRSLVRAIGWCA